MRKTRKTTIASQNEFELREFDSLDSTNALAKELAAAGAAPWTVVLALRQAQGRGKKAAGWYSPKGGLYFSIILPKSNIDDLQTLTILAAFIVAKTIKDKFQAEPLIKLPNDVLLGGKKVCGILTENIIGGEVKASVMGIGINTNVKNFPPELEKTATSLKIELGRDIDNKEILRQIVTGLKKTLVSISQ
jgi:biotin-[acetyl-CoA-carboxylase] ligase BirA-like protein